MDMSTAKQALKRKEPAVADYCAVLHIYLAGVNAKTQGILVLLLPGNQNTCWIAYHDPASAWLLVVFILCSLTPSRNLQSLDSALIHESTWKMTKSNANQSLSHVLFSAFQSSSLLPVLQRYWSIQTSTLDGSIGKTHISSFHLLAQSLEAALLQQHHITE